MPAEEVDRLEASVIKEFVKHARIQGFRPGKAPVDRVRKQYASEIQNEWVSKIRKSATDKAFKDSGLKIFGFLKADVSDVQLGKAVDVSLVVELAPEFDLPAYESIAITVPSTQLKEEEIDNAIMARQKALSKFEVVEKPAEKSDYVNVSYEGFIDGQSIKDLGIKQPIFTVQNRTWEEAGAEDAPGVQSIIQGIIGLKAEDKATFLEHFPEDFRESALAGKAVSYEVTVHEVRTRVLPALDSSEFLKEHGVDSVDAFRSMLTERLQAHKEEAALNTKANRVMEAFRKQVVFEVPETALKNKLPELVNRFLASDVARKTPADVLERDKDKILADLQGLAIQRLQDEFILDKVAHQEAMKVEEADLQRRLFQEAAEERLQIGDYVKKLQKSPEAIRHFQRRALQYKALEFLMERVTVTVES